MASIGKRGASSDEDAPANKKKISTDDEVLNLLKNFSKGGIDERKTEILMHQWIKGRNKNAKDLLAECGLSQGGDLYEAELNILENVGGLGTVRAGICCQCCGRRYIGPFRDESSWEGVMESQSYQR